MGSKKKIKGKLIDLIVIKYNQFTSKIEHERYVEENSVNKQWLFKIIKFKLGKYGLHLNFWGITNEVRLILFITKIYQNYEKRNPSYAPNTCLH